MVRAATITNNIEVKMNKLCMGFLTLILLLSLICHPAWAGPAMERIKQTGVIRVGFRNDSIPFCFFDSMQGKHLGFSADMAGLLTENLSKRLGKKISIEPFSVTAQNRIQKVAEGAVDVEMGSTTVTAKREHRIDFSLPFFFSETTFLVSAKSSITELKDLNGKRIGCTRKTTNLTALRRAIKEGKVKPRDTMVVSGHREGMQALKDGKIDAYCTDHSLLQGLRMKSVNPAGWRILDLAIAYEAYAYLCRQNDSEFRDFINNTIIWAIKSGKFQKLYDKWMGPKAEVPIKISRAYGDYLKMISYPMAKDWWKPKPY
jgi:ABC-type amino acid transport substrate-binding protein